MSGRSWTFLLLFVAGEIVGVGIGEWYFHLFLKAVPPVALSQFNTQAARIAYWLYGAGVGVGFFLWAWLGIAVNRLSQMGNKSDAKS